MDADQLRPTVARLFDRPARRTTRVGVEQELLLSEAGTGGVVAIESARAALHGLRCVAFEPGGQLELSLPAAPGPAAAAEDLRERLVAVTARLALAGIRPHAAPVDTRTDVPLQLTSPRYVAMQRHFDTIGPAGRVMMRRTASTQMCLDWWPGEAGLEQWRVLNLAGPFVAAALSRSAGPDGRLATWLEVDPARTGFDDRLLYGDPISAYADFAAGATGFVDGGPDEHLTTLFPPVRPRGSYLEVRFLDVQEAAVVGDVAAQLCDLVYDDARRRRALLALENERPVLAEHWKAAAAGIPETAARGRELLGISQQVAA